VRAWLRARFPSLTDTDDLVQESYARLLRAEDAIEGARTKALKGTFTRVEAMERLLSGTDLKAAHDRESGSFAVSRVLDPPKETSRPNG
jgi:hypothetical protein